MARDVDETTFDDVVKTGVVFVDFFATWCPPCRMMHPVVEEIEKRYKGKAEFIKVDVDKNSKLAIRYSIMSVPTFMVFKDGKPISTVIGAVPQDELAKMIDEALNER